jgi:O-antigen/teichoic acid export membrane protein
MGLSALTAAVVARSLGATGYGYYAAGIAAYGLALAFSELGFGIVVTREMARNPEGRGVLLRSAVHVQLLWSGVIAAALAIVGAAEGVSTRGDVMIVMAPAVLVSGLSSMRQLFLVNFKLERLFVVDLVTAIVQATAMITMAVLGLGAVAIAGAYAATICVNQLAGAWLGRRLLDSATTNWRERRRILRLAIPLGLASLLASLYFTIDLVVLTWLVSAAELGQYAAAVRLLTLVVVIPGFIMQAGIPALAQATHDRAALSAVAGRLAHWISATALPLCVALAVFAKPAIDIVFGHAFAGAIPLLRILMIAGALSLASNVLGIVLSTLSIVRPQLFFNSIALTISVVGNILLVPTFGVTGSAWLTVGCEVLIVSYALYAVHRHVALSAVITPSLRSLAATAAAATLGVLLAGTPAIGITASVLLFIVLVRVLRAWPADLIPARWRSA